jgi:hypothetical protein
MPPYSYKSIQKCVRGSGRGCGRRTVTRKVIIEGGSGYKQLNKTRKRLTRKEISHIKRGKFIPGLFKDLHP